MVALAIVIITGLSGCLTTLFPLFTKNDVVFDPKLVGKWDTGKDGKLAVFERGSASAFTGVPELLQQIASQGYVVTFTSQDGYEESKYYAFMMKLGKYNYLDYYPADTKMESHFEEFYKLHFTKMHSFFRVRFNDEESFEISQFDEGFLKDLIDRKQIRIRHEKKIDGNYLITAPTAELQQYVMKYGDVPGAYNKERIATYKKIQ